MCSAEAYVAVGTDRDENILDQEESEFTRLTDLVRNHYMNYLEKQLLENFKTCYTQKQHEGIHFLDNEEAIGPIKQTAKLLENKAVAACMIAQFYQRAMVKIISTVRRSTEDNQLILQLENTISQKFICNLGGPCSKQTQTDEAELHEQNAKTFTMDDDEAHLATVQEKGHEQEMTLDEKIEFFQNHIKSEHKLNRPTHVKRKRSFRSQRTKVPPTKHNNSQKDNRYQTPFTENLNSISPTNTVITVTHFPKAAFDEHANNPAQSVDAVIDDLENSNDSVADNLARLFSEEKTELDEIFGIDPNEEPDDPQIRKILKEIEEAKINHKHEPNNDTEKSNNEKTSTQQTLSSVHVNLTTPKRTDLTQSIWPCELFMQKKKLSASLSVLIEEDLRWYDVMKWRFFDLFGEDSDDEFTTCSPSIELDEILMSSCVRRISPWVVKYLMKPLNDGLIGNRFIFKKLAKHIARSIILENQYPDESVIKRFVANYFCLHQSVLSLDDINNAPIVSLC